MIPKSVKRFRKRSCPNKRKSDGSDSTKSNQTLGVASLRLGALLLFDRRRRHVPADAARRLVERRPGLFHFGVVLVLVARAFGLLVKMDLDRLRQPPAHRHRPRHFAVVVRSGELRP